MSDGGVNVGTAYLEVVPTTKGFQDNLTRATGSASAKAGADSSRKFGSGMTSGVGGIASKVGGLLAGGIAAVGVKDFISSSIDEARESQKVGALTAQVIKSTGGAAKITADQVGALSMAISTKTGIDDEAIQSASNLLLTFTGVRNEVGKGNDVFNQATQIATDMGAALGGDPKSAAIQLGKALNDPVKGITALQRVGVSFTKSQKDQIAAMVKSGNTLGAQKVILGELNREFGGAAAASATAGEKSTVAFKNLQEQIGTAMLPVIDKLATVFTTKVAPAISTFISGMSSGTGAGGQFVTILKAAWSVLSTVFNVLKPFGKEIAIAAAAFIAFKVAGDGIKSVRNGIQSVKDSVQATKDVLKAAKGAAGEFKKGLDLGAQAASGGQFATLGQAIKTAASNAVSAVGAFAKAAASAVASAARTAAAWAAAAARSVASFVSMAAGAAAQAARTALAWVASVARTVASLVAQGAAFIASRVAMLAGAAATGIVTAAQWALNVAMSANPIALIVIALVALVAGLIYAYKHSETFRNIVLGVWTVIKTTVMTVVNWLKAAVPAVFAFIKNAFLRFTILGIVISHWSQIKAFIGAAVNTIKGIIAWFGSLPGKFAGWFGQAYNAIVSKVNAAVTFVAGLPGRILGALGNLGSLLFNSGKSIIQGLIDGITHMAGNVTGAISGVLSKARNLLPFSPAKEGPFSGRGWTLYSGQAISTALGEGITSAAGRPVAAARQLAANMHAALSVGSPSLAMPGVGSGLGSARISGAVGQPASAGRAVTINATINNPTAEPAGKSLHTTLSKVAYLGLAGDD